MDAKNGPSNSATSKAGKGSHVTNVNFHPMDVNRRNDEDSSPTDVILAVQGLVGMGTHGFATEAAILVDITTSTITATSMTTSKSLSSSSSHVSSINDAVTAHSFNPSSISSYGIGTTSTSIFSKLPSGAMSTFTALRNSMRPPVRQSEEHLLDNNKDECEGESDNEEKSTTGSRGSLARQRMRLKETPGGLLPSSSSSATNRFLSSAILYDDKESRHHSSDMTGRLSSPSTSTSSSSSSSTGLPVTMLPPTTTINSNTNNNNNSSTATFTNDAFTGNPSYSADMKALSAMSHDSSASASGRSKISGITSSRTGGAAGNDGSVSRAGGASGNDICEQLQPKLVLIFDTYCQHTQQPRINTSKPLLMLCLEHLVPFGCWVRETPNGCEWIREVLEDHVDLRPEVRNGLCMLVIYGLCAVRVRDLAQGQGLGQGLGKLGLGPSLDSEGNPVDIFSILACQHMGFGIVNKTSIRVYTDPLKRFAFLKLVLSGVIDAGRLPENERVGNQPKKCKKPELLHDELMRYEHMCALFRATYARGGQGLPPGQGLAPGQGLVSVDDCGKMIEALVLQILTAWQMCGKNVRNQWFTVAVAAITSRTSHVNPFGEAAAGAAGKGADVAAPFSLEGVMGGHLSSSAAATAKASSIGLVVGSGIALGGVQGLGQPVVPYSAQGLGLGLTRGQGQGLFAAYPPTPMWPGIASPVGGVAEGSSYGEGSGGTYGGGGGGAGKERPAARKSQSAEGSATGGRSRGAGGGARSKGGAGGGASTKSGGRAAGGASGGGAGSAQLPCLQEEEENSTTAGDSGGAAAAAVAAREDRDGGAMVVAADSDSERGVSPSVEEGGTIYMEGGGVDMDINGAGTSAESGEGMLSVERVRSKVSQCNLGKRRRGKADVDEGQGLTLGQGQGQELQVMMTSAPPGSSVAALPQSSSSSSSSSYFGVQPPLPPPQQHQSILPPSTLPHASSLSAAVYASAAASTVPPATSTIPSSSSSSSHYSMPPLLSTLWAGMAGQPQPQAAACVCRVMCFERVDTREWEIRDCRVAVADVIALLAGVQGQQPLYLIDESHLQLSSSDGDDAREATTLNARGLGLGVSLQAELKLRQGAIVAAWPKALHTSVRDFLFEWMQQQQQQQNLQQRQHQTTSLSLLEFWYMYDQTHFRGGSNQTPAAAAHPYNDAHAGAPKAGQEAGSGLGLGLDDGVVPAEPSLLPPTAAVREDHAAMVVDDGCCHDGSNGGGGGSSGYSRGEGGGGADFAARSLFDVVKMARDMTRSSSITQSQGDDHRGPSQSGDDTTLPAAASAAACRSHHHQSQEPQTEVNQSMLQLSRGYGVIAYEVTVKIGFVLRANPVLGLPQDTWRVFYPRELERLVVLACHTAASSSASSSSSSASLALGASAAAAVAAVSFGQLLGQLFPQLNRPPITQAAASHTHANLTTNANNTGSSTMYVQGEASETVVVTYYPHSKLSPFDGLPTNHAQQHPHQSQQQQQPPPLLSSDAYQTLGTLAEPAMTMMERLDASAHVAWHDLILTSY